MLANSAHFHPKAEITISVKNSEFLGSQLKSTFKAETSYVIAGLTRTTGRVGQQTKCEETKSAAASTDFMVSMTNASEGATSNYRKRSVRRVRVESHVTSCKDAMTKAIKRHDQLLALTLKVDDSASLLKEQETWLNVLTTANDEVLKRARQSIDSIPATDKASQSSSKTAKKTVSNRSGNSATSNTSSQRQKELLIAKQRREELKRQHEGALHLAKQKQEIELQKFQQEQQWLQLEKEHLHPERLQRLQEQEQQLQFQEQRLQKEQLMEVLELEEEARRRIAGAQIAELQSNDYMSESTEESELKDTLSKLSTASRGVELQRVTDWVHNGSVVENNNQSHLNVADADPTACNSVHPTPMGISLPVNPEGVVINNASFDDLPHDPITLFHQQSCAARTSLSMPVVTSGLIDAAFPAPPFNFAFVDPRTIVESRVSNPVQAVLLHVPPSLQQITTVTTVTPQRFTAPITTNSSFSTQIFPTLSCCTNPFPRVIQQPIITSQAVTIPVETSKQSWGNKYTCCNIFYCNPPSQTAPYSNGNVTPHMNKAR